ncbi:hypothetical protein ACQQ6W_11060 [Lysinibacillus fusiformis]
MKINRFKDIDLEELDTWPTVLEKNLSEKNLYIFTNRKAAITDYLKGKGISEICDKYSITKSNFFRLFSRCLETNIDGRINGFRALIPYKRIDKSNNKLFAKLLNQHPILAEQLTKDFLNINSPKEVKEKNMSLKTIHKRFLRKCAELGITLDSYPFNTKSKGYKSLQRYVSDLKSTNFIKVASRHGEEALMLAKNSGTLTKPLADGTLSRPYERVEFDGHKIDISLALAYTTPEGDEIIDVINRIWILTIIDVATRCILGYHLCLSKEYSADDVLMTIRNAVFPWKPRELTIPNLKYSQGAALPSYLIKETEYAIWDEFCYDNAKANIAKVVQDKLVNLIGCSINMGPVATPIRRPHIERFFRTLETNGFQRITSTTGNSLKDPKRNKNSEATAVKYQITTHHIEDLTDVLVADYNNTPHDSLYGLTPLEAMKQRIDKGIYINTISSNNRKDLAFFSIKTKRRVNGNVKHGRRPFITYEGVKYTSDLLAHSPHLIGKTLTLEVNIEDLRVLKVYLENGEELGTLTATKKWALKPHSLRERKAINKLKNDRKILFSNEEDPIEIYHIYLKKNATTKNGRNKLATFEKNLKSKSTRYKESKVKHVEEEPKNTVSAFDNTKPTTKLRRTLHF